MHGPFQFDSQISEPPTYNSLRGQFASRLVKIEVLIGYTPTRTQIVACRQEIRFKLFFYKTLT